MKLYVSNLDFAVLEENLQELFATHGRVDGVTLAREPYSGESRGFGFVDMPDDDARAAMDALHGRDYRGRPLRVSQARGD